MRQPRRRRRQREVFLVLLHRQDQAFLRHREERRRRTCRRSTAGHSTSAVTSSSSASASITRRAACAPRLRSCARDLARGARAKLGDAPCLRASSVARVGVGGRDAMSARRQEAMAARHAAGRRGRARRPARRRSPCSASSRCAGPHELRRRCIAVGDAGSASPSGSAALRDRFVERFLQPALERRALRERCAGRRTRPCRRFDVSDRSRPRIEPSASAAPSAASFFAAPASAGRLRRARPDRHQLARRRPRPARPARTSVIEHGEPPRRRERRAATASRRSKSRARSRRDERRRRKRCAERLQRLRRQLFGEELDRAGSWSPSLMRAFMRIARVRPHVVGGEHREAQRLARLRSTPARPAATACGCGRCRPRAR